MPEIKMPRIPLRFAIGGVILAVLSWVWVCHMHQKISVGLQLTSSSLLDGNLNLPVVKTTLDSQGSTYSGKQTFYPGELPGYTGWPRPAMTLARSFRMLRPCSSTSKANVNWTCSVHCSHEACRNGGSLFFVRAYGPAILPGIVTDHHNGTYGVTFIPMDEGIYTVEVVLTFSNPPHFSTFPLEAFTEPAYEGYMLPSFPVTVTVTERPYVYSPTTIFKQGRLPVCTLPELLESSPTSALETGRWVVAEKMVGRPFSRTNHSYGRKVTLDGYRRGDNSLGVRMHYHPINCSLFDEAAVKGAAILHECMQQSQYNFSNRRLHLVLVGDSNMLAQDDWARDAGLFGHRYKRSFVGTHDGINVKLPEIKKNITQLIKNDSETGVSSHYVVIFNSGLHDIIHLCGSEYFGLNISFIERGHARCVDTYRRRLREFASMMKEFPSALTVFQTTTAAWPKWGLFGNAWPADKKQSLPFSSSFAEHFNEIAWEVMKEFDIPVMDTYWLTLSRPDHREVNKENGIAEKMAHAGVEVYSVLVRKWAMLILETICPSAR
jgi:hypothetical protein